MSPNIYISSACVPDSRVDEAIDRLLSHGIFNIELSGGDNKNSSLLETLLEYQTSQKVNFLLHNYFPPADPHIVLNLASLNDQVYASSLSNYKKSIDFSKELGLTKFGLHAGFTIDLELSELGRTVRKRALFSKDECIERLVAGYKELQDYAGGLRLYLENNVISKKNIEVFGCDPFLLTSSDDFFALRDVLDFNLLLDVAHLKVSANSLDLNFEVELDRLMEHSDYIHISDNDGLEDQNIELRRDSEMYNILRRHSFFDKTVTLEIYKSFPLIVESKAIMEGISQCLKT